MSRVKDLMMGRGVGCRRALALVAFATEQNLDPLKLSPQYYTLRVDNARVRVYEYRLPPGQKEVMHSHLPGVVFALSTPPSK